jgi:hypothetical protein
MWLRDGGTGSEHLDNIFLITLIPTSDSQYNMKEMAILERGGVPKCVGRNEQE